MPDLLTVITNHHERKVIEAWELPESKRKDFDYLDWPAILEGSDSARFVEYRGQIYDLDEFTRTPEPLRDWDGYLSDSYFSGVVFKWAMDGREIVPEYVIMGRYYA